MAVRYLAAHEAVRKLRDNMREEHVLVLDFVSTIFKHVRRLRHCACCAALRLPAAGCCCSDGPRLPARYSSFFQRVAS